MPFHPLRRTPAALTAQPGCNTTAGFGGKGGAVHSAGDDLRQRLDAALERASSESGQVLEWTEQELLVLERAQATADRAEDLSRRLEEQLAAETPKLASVVVRLSAEIRLLGGTGLHAAGVSEVPASTAEVQQVPERARLPCDRCQSRTAIGRNRRRSEDEPRRTTVTHPQPVVESAVGSSTAITGVNGIHVEPRCRVCRNDQLRTKVNDLLASGASYAMIVRALEDDNVKLQNGDRVTIDSIRNHCVRHFPVQNIAKATYREILERRAQENGVDFVNGVASALTPMALYETIMVKGYESLADRESKVDVNTAMVAASRLQALLDARAGQPDVVEFWVQTNRIIAAVKTMLPESSWPELVRRIEGDAPANPQHHHIGTVHDADEEYAPRQFADMDDDDW
jgi:hypothetical protein